MDEVIPDQACTVAGLALLSKACSCAFMSDNVLVACLPLCIISPVIGIAHQATSESCFVHICSGLILKP